MKSYADYVNEVKGTSYITDIPIGNFASIQDLEAFVKDMKANRIGAVLHYETSNYHCGVVVQAYDIETCEVKEYLGGVK